MKLSPNFLIHVQDDEHLLIPVSDAKFSGVVRGNRTAAFIVDLLKEETTEDAIIDAMCGQYDAPRETIAADVTAILNTLRGIGALEE